MVQIYCLKNCIAIAKIVPSKCFWRQNTWPNTVHFPFMKYWTIIVAWEHIETVIVFKSFLIIVPSTKYWVRSGCFSSAILFKKNQEQENSVKKMSFGLKKHNWEERKSINRSYFILMLDMIFIIKSFDLWLQTEILLHNWFGNLM